MKTIYEKSLGLSPLIQIEKVGGSLQIKGWMRSEVFVSSEDEQVDLTETDEGLILRSSTDCLLRVPRAARLEIGQIGGNVRIKYVDANLNIEQIGGSLVCRSIGNLAVKTIQGNGMLKDVLGDITCQQVGGSLIARQVQGEIRLGQVGGNLDARHLSDSLSATVGGSCRVEWNVFNGSEVNLRVGGSIHCEISDALQPRLNLHSGAQDIRLIQFGQKEQYAKSQTSLSLGEGLYPFEFQAGGKIILVVRPALSDEEEEDIDAMFNEEVNHISERVRRQLQAQMEAFQQRMNQFTDQMEGYGVEVPPVETIPNRRRSSSHDSSARIQEKMRRAQERMEQKLNEAQRRSESKPKLSFMEKIGFGRKKEASTQAAVSDTLEEERLYILKMLEQKKITVAEAEKLLAALEGKA